MPGMRSLGVGSFIHAIAVSLSFVSCSPNSRSNSIIRPMSMP
jgi:hypothetical protein